MINRGRFLTGVGVASMAMLGHAAVSVLDAPKRPDGDDEDEREVLYCPYIGVPLEPAEVTTVDVDDETWATDHWCLCGRTHRFHHDDDDASHASDVSHPGGDTIR